uniref:LEM domain-containing protein n=1 Tax=Monopterus albus TaxID=43700 RepID=A0A3Q3K645_MONAL
MSSLSSKSVQEISDLLDEYGIKHGPIVDTTRVLYEKKIKEAMAKGKRAKPSPDKTIYREEEDITYVYSTPVSTSLSYMYDTPSTYSSSYLKSTPMKFDQDAPKAPKAPKSSRLIPLWVQFVCFLAVAVFLYLVFSSMEKNESLKEIQ